MVTNARQAIAVDERRYDFRPELWKDAHAHQTLEQRWFPGVHSNVGGGHLQDGLANIAFHWLLGEACKLGLATDVAYARHHAAYPGGRQYTSYTLAYEHIEAVRLRRGKGARRLVDHAAGARLAVDASVIRRMQADPREHDQMDGPYRPGNVIDYLATKDDLPAYLASLGLPAGRASLPDDLLQAIARRRGASGR